MSFNNWQDACKNLASAIEPFTAKQQQLSKKANITIGPKTPKIVAAALLQLGLSEELNLASASPVSAGSKGRIKALRKKSDPKIHPSAEEEARAWVAYLYLLRRKESLERLKLTEGDVVKTESGIIAEVSSINLEGRVFFKGGRGFCSWPDLLTVLARQGSKSKYLQQAQNTASRVSSDSAWSEAKNKELRDFVSEKTLDEYEIDELEAIISSAKDERPIQKYLENNVHILTSLLGGNTRFCIPQKRLGGEYVPDFIIGDVNSLGIRWVLVELETPRSGIYLENGQELDKNTRKGVSQIVTWRTWLSDNLSYARQAKSKNGLSLFDIREKSDALVIVGRRSRMPNTNEAHRIEYRQSSNIQIHTYDWLLEQMRGIIKYQGVPATNPYLIPRIAGDEHEKWWL
jgi:hypothetical protein